MRSMRTPTAAVLFTLASVLAGCGSAGTNGHLPAEPATRTAVQGEPLMLKDPRRGTENGESFLELTLTNPSSGRIAVRCAPAWFDAQGRPIAAVAAWRAVDLAPGAEARLRFAPMPEAARSWRLQFEGPR
jgi:hypothetical protein